MIDIQKLKEDVENWRKSKKSLQERMPEDLKKRIFDGVNHYSISELRQRLNLNHDFFNQKLYNKKTKKSAPRFVQTQLSETVPSIQSLRTVKLQIGNISLEITG